MCTFAYLRRTVHEGGDDTTMTVTFFAVGGAVPLGTVTDAENLTLPTGLPGSAVRSTFGSAALALSSVFLLFLL